MRRLDLSRPVDPELVKECIVLAHAIGTGFLPAYQLPPERITPLGHLVADLARESRGANSAR